MTTEDVKYSFERVLDPQRGSPYADNLRPLKAVRVVSPDTVHLITDRPFPLLLERLVLLAIVPKQHVGSGCSTPDPRRAADRDRECARGAGVAPGDVVASATQPATGGRP